MARKKKGQLPSGSVRIQKCVGRDPAGKRIMKSFIRANSDDSVTVVINSRLSFESQKERFKHELEHLAAGDLEHGGCADQIERERHR